MNYISNCKLEYLIECYAKNALYELNSAELRGFFKTEYFARGQLDILKKLSNDLNLQIDIDKLKI